MNKYQQMAGFRGFFSLGTFALGSMLVGIGAKNHQDGLERKIDHALIGAGTSFLLIGAGLAVSSLLYMAKANRLRAYLHPNLSLNAGGFQLRF